MEEENKPTVPEENIEKIKEPLNWKELLRFGIIALIITVTVRLWVAEPFIVSGSSMVPTFENGDYLIVDKLSYELGGPKRDDVVIFRYPGDPSKFFIKRIIGLPDETVDVKDNTVTIINKSHPEGFNLEEPYVKNFGGINKRFELARDEYFVMGDNRIASSDSRYWGAVNKKFLTGRALLRLTPFKNIGLMPGNYKQK